jgi:formylglycine-generating enzyme required for sulfatase activity
MRIIKGSHRVQRGGSWLLHAYYCTVSSRHYSFPFHRYDLIGFRMYVGGVR